MRILLFTICSLLALHVDSLHSAHDTTTTNIEDIAQDLCDAVVNVVDDNGNSIGSGFIISADGYIVTNNHVIDSSTENKPHVVCSDGTKLVAKVIGSDVRFDIALLKVSAGKVLPFLKFANSDEIKLCERVIAIGSPFGFDSTITSGIISRKSRNISNSIRQIGGGDLVDYIQTDTSINNGNSGGPLIAATGKNIGKVVGMITSIFSDSESSSGVSFAIPSNNIKFAVTQLQEFGRIKRAWLGVSFINLDHAVLSALKISKYSNAVMVTKVEDNSPASAAGVLPNDVILSINKLDLANTNRANMIVASLVVGTTAEVEILRDAKIIELKLRVGYKEQNEPSEQNLVATLKKQPGVFIKELGMTVANISPELIGALNIPYKQNGVIVSDINGIVSEQNDINTGDLIININLKQTNNVEEFQQKISDVRSLTNTVALYIKRRGESFFRVLPIRR